MIYSISINIFMGIEFCIPEFETTQSSLLYITFTDKVWASSFSLDICSNILCLTYYKYNNRIDKKAYLSMGTYVTQPVLCTLYRLMQENFLTTQGDSSSHFSDRKIVSHQDHRAQWIYVSYWYEIMNSLFILNFFMFWSNPPSLFFELWLAFLLAFLLAFGWPCLALGWPFVGFLLAFWLTFVWLLFGLWLAFGWPLDGL